MNSSSAEEELSPEEQIKVFEKSILYMVLTLQTIYYTSEGAAQFVISNLIELFLAISTAELV